MFFEWCRTTRSRSGNMVPETLLTKILAQHDPGYRSVYSFAEADAREIKASCASQGFRDYTPASSCIVIDLDDGNATLPLALDRILERKLRCEVWFSGMKGYHLILFHTPIHDKRLPYSHFLYVQDLLDGLEFDSSLYRASSLIALPGRIHKDTKKRKRLVEVWEGNDVDLPLIQKPEPKWAFAADGGMDKLQAAVSHLQDLSVRQPVHGQRHNRIWLCAKSFCEAGVSFDAALELLQAVNETWPDPKSRAEVDAATEQAYA